MAPVDKDTSGHNYKCAMCNKSFYKQTQLQDHRKEHRQKLYECDLCEFTCTRPNNLTSHNLTHTQEKPYLCNICGKGFVQAKGLKDHSYTHTEENNSHLKFVQKYMHILDH